MFYYVIYNSTILNYAGNNKNLNTFIYGTVLYILLHGLINSYTNQFAIYIKSYFWVILAIDIFSIYYMYNYINPENDSETTNSLKSLLDTFKKTNDDTKKGKENENEKGKGKGKDKEKDKLSDDDTQNDDDDDIENDIENEITNENIEDQMSDGSDIDLDNFEMTLS
jgi:hypothetical protein